MSICHFSNLLPTLSDDKYSSTLFQSAIDILSPPSEMQDEHHPMSSQPQHTTPSLHSFSFQLTCGGFPAAKTSFLCDNHHPPPFLDFRPLTHPSTLSPTSTPQAFIKIKFHFHTLPDPNTDFMHVTPFLQTSLSTSLRLLISSFISILDSLGLANILDYHVYYTYQSIIIFLHAYSSRQSMESRY